MAPKILPAKPGIASAGRGSSGGGGGVGESGLLPAGSVNPLSDSLDFNLDGSLPTVRMEGKIDKLLEGLEFLQRKASQHQDDLSLIKENLERNMITDENKCTKNEEDDFRAEGYVVGDVAGSGNNIVYMVKEVGTNASFAIKRILLGDDKVTPAIARELALMYDIRHDHIVRLHSSFICGQSICLVLDLAPDGDLEEFIILRKVITPDRIREWMKQMISAVAYLHNRKIIHRDLKSGNILLTKDGIKVCDFGLARHFFDGDSLSPQVMTLEYRAPEIFLGCDTYTSAVDMWSIGCIFWEMVMLEKLFEFGDMKKEVMIEQIFKKLGTPSESTWPGVTATPNFPRDIPLYESQVLEIKTELSAANLSAAGIDLLERLLCYDPKKRISAGDALKHPYFELGSDNEILG